MKFMVVRHGEYVVDLERIKNGDLDPELSGEGKEKVIRLAKRMKARFREDRLAIFSSPTKRTMESAEIIREELGAPTVICREQLRGADYNFTGPEVVKLIFQKEQKEKEWLSGSLVLMGLETAESVLQRTKEELFFLKQNARKEGLSIVIVVAHEETVLAFKSLLTGISMLEASQKDKIDFASLWEFSL